MTTFEFISCTQDLDNAGDSQGIHSIHSTKQICRFSLPVLLQIKSYLFF